MKSIVHIDNVLDIQQAPNILEKNKYMHNLHLLMASRMYCVFHILQCMGTKLKVFILGRIFLYLKL